VKRTKPAQGGMKWNSKAHFRRSAVTVTTYTIQDWRPAQAAGGLKGKSSARTYLGELKLASGQVLIRIQQGEYRIFGTDIILKSADPGAP
jgi:hypothetical protein